MDPPAAMQWTKVVAGRALDEARRHREQPRAVRDLPALRRVPRLGRPPLGRVHARLRAPRQRLRQRLARPPLRDGGPPRRRRRRRRATTSRMRDATTSRVCRRASWSRTLLDGMVDRQARDAAGEPAERRQRHEPARRRGRRDHGRRRRVGVRGRDQATVPGIMGEFLRRINVVQEWTVEAARHRRPRRSCSKRCSPTRWPARSPYDDVVDDDRRDARRHRPLAPAVPTLTPSSSVATCQVRNAATCERRPTLVGSGAAMAGRGS